MERAYRIEWLRTMSGTSIIHAESEGDAREKFLDMDLEKSDADLDDLEVLGIDRDYNYDY